MRNIIIYSAFALLLGFLAGCKPRGNTASESKQAVISLAEEETKAAPSRLTKQLPEYYGVFYVGPDSLIEIREGAKNTLLVYSSAPQFYVYGRAQVEMKYFYDNPNGEAWSFWTRVYPMKNSVGDLVHKIQLPPE